VPSFRQAATAWLHHDRSIRRRRRYLANGTETASQQAQDVYDDSECAPHQTSSVDGVNTDVSMQSGPVQARSAPSRNYSQSRILQLELCSRRRDDPTPSRYWNWDTLCFDPVQSSSVLSAFNLNLLADIRWLMCQRCSPSSESLPWWCTWTTAIQV